MFIQRQFQNFQDDSWLKPRQRQKVNISHSRETFYQFKKIKKENSWKLLPFKKTRQKTLMLILFLFWMGLASLVLYSGKQAYHALTTKSSTEKTQKGYAYSPLNLGQFFVNTLKEENHLKHVFMEKFKPLEEARIHKEQRIEALSRYISHVYRIAPSAATRVVKRSYLVAQQQHIDPLLLLSVVSVESRFNPFAGSRVGAIGLVQAMPSAHPEKVKPLVQKGVPLTDVASNLEMGSQILSEYLKKYHGNQILALQQYNGNLADKQHRYANKVLESLTRFKRVVQQI